MKTARTIRPRYDLSERWAQAHQPMSATNMKSMRKRINAMAIRMLGADSDEHPQNLLGTTGHLYFPTHGVLMGCKGRIGLILSAVLLAGCVRRTMTIESDPPGALVYMNNQEVGRTPVTREFIWYGFYDVQLRRDGYKTLN